MRNRCETILPPPMDPLDDAEGPASGAYAYACVGVGVAWPSYTYEEEAPDTEREERCAHESDDMDTWRPSAPIWARDTLPELDPQD